ncbi:MAG: biopolymer transporter ExbD [Desulfatirhabdiaceae bacterium]
MKVRNNLKKKARIEMLPLMDVVFLVLAFFIYAMLSMSVHRSLPVSLPVSETAEIDQNRTVSVTIRRDGGIFVDRSPVNMDSLARVLSESSGGNPEKGVLLFADRSVAYEDIFRVLDKIRLAGLSRISLQAEVEPKK